MSTDCPERELLLDLLWRRGGGPAETEEVNHLTECENCRMELEMLQESARVLRDWSEEEPTADGPCLDEIEVVEAAEGGIRRSSDPEAVAGHLTTCTRCRSAVSSMAELMEDGRVKAELSALTREPRGSKRAWRWGAVGLAAAATLALLLLPDSPRAPTDSGIHRAAAESSAEPNPLSPTGVVSDFSRFEWSGVAEADRYRLIVYDRNGEVVLDEIARDTALGVPESLNLEEGGRYFWKVEARVGFDRWITSELREFTVEVSR